MNKILTPILVFLSLFLMQCAKSETVSIENETPKVKLPAIKEFVLGKTWENKLRKLGTMDWDKLYNKGEKGMPLFRFTFQENNTVKIENYKIAADGEQNLITLEGNNVRVKLISGKEYQYRIQNENELIIDYKQPHLVIKKDEETILIGCINKTDHPLPGCDFSLFEYRKLNQ